MSVMVKKIQQYFLKFSYQAKCRFLLGISLVALLIIFLMLINTQRYAVRHSLTQKSGSQYQQSAIRLLINSIRYPIVLDNPELSHPRRIAFVIRKNISELQEKHKLDFFNRLFFPEWKSPELNKKLASLEKQRNERIPVNELMDVIQEINKN